MRQTVAYEGQAAIELEALAESSSAAEHYPFSFSEVDGRLVLDFSDMLRSLVQDVLDNRPREDLARRFHNTLAVAASEVCEEIRAATGLQRVVLSGGVFQNRLFSEGLSTHLEQKNFQVYSQRLAPPNDGGLALGQAIIAGRSQLCV